MLLTRFGEATDGQYRVLLGQRVRDVDDRQLCGREPRRIENHLDLAGVARLHLDGARAGHARDLRLDDEVRVVVEIGSRQRAREAHDEHREDGRRHPLDLKLRARRQLAGNFRDAVLHHLQCRHHVGRGIELGRDLRAADAFDARASHPTAMMTARSGGSR